MSVTSNAPAIFPPGRTIVRFTAVDASGNTAVASTTVTVVGTTPPVIQAVSPSTGTLWPPNHKLVPITLAGRALDRVDPSVACRVVRVTSSEPTDGLGDGATAPDWLITAALTVQLRAERSGAGPGRVYTIAVSCSDAAGNTVTKTTAVVVPYDQGK